MEKKYPKLLFRDGNEHQVTKINNNCKMTLLTRIRDAFPIEYNIVKNDPVFAHVFAIHENGLGYSARLIHSIMCRQLVTNKKHELWFVFGRKPLRFSMQEFYAVTVLKYEDDFSCDLENWKADTGYWSKLLKREDKIHIKKLMDVHLIEVPTWSDEKDRIRFVYVCVIVGLIMATDEKKIIPLLYIRMVMDLDKVRNYPWGLVSFEHLVKSIIKTRKSLKNVKSYALDGFSYSLQIWVMEAIPVIGELLGAKINKELTGSPRCSNWKGAAKVSYDDIIILEKSIGPKRVVFCAIVVVICARFCAMDFLRPDEIIDSEVHNLNELISSGCDFGDHVWENVVDVVDGDETQNVEEHDGVDADNDVPENGNEISHLTDDDSQNDRSHIFQQKNLFLI